MAEAEALEKSGKKEEAELILGAPITAPEVVLPSTTKMAGISDRTYWSVEVFDLIKLCRAVADGKIPTSYIQPHFINLNSLARSLKNSMNAQWQAFGVRAVSRNDIAGGR